MDRAGNCWACDLITDSEKKKRDIQIRRKKPYLDGLNAMREKSSSTQPPNIILILCDDLGYGDIACYGPTVIKTPNIQRLAKDGVTFTNFYASSSICSPSRAGCLTGRYPIRSHVPAVFFPYHNVVDIAMAPFFYAYGMRGMAEDEITIAEVLQKAGYVTGAIGKWHLGDHSPYYPNERGFDFFYGAHYSNDMYPYEIYRNRTVEIKKPVDQNQLTKLLTKECVDFITQNKDKPFFLYYPQPAPHEPLHVGDEFRKSSAAGLYGDMVQEVDWSVGEILKTVEQCGLKENTLIIFSSDNGPWHLGSPGFIRGRKALSYEGGFRVPMIARWSGKIPAGTTISEMAMNIDFFPTFLHLAGVPLPTDRIIDGKNIFPLMEGSNPKTPHDFLYFFANKKLHAIRSEKWKYHIRHGSDNSSYFIVKVGPHLFDLERDPNESYDISQLEPEKAQELHDQLMKMKKHINENCRGWV